MTEATLVNELNLKVNKSRNHSYIIAYYLLMHLRTYYKYHHLAMVAVEKVADNISLGRQAARQAAAGGRSQHDFSPRENISRHFHFFILKIK